MFFIRAQLYFFYHFFFNIYKTIMFLSSRKNYFLNLLKWNLIPRDWKLNQSWKKRIKFHSFGVQITLRSEVTRSKQRREISFLWSESHFKRVKPYSKRVSFLFKSKKIFTLSSRLTQLFTPKDLESKIIFFFINRCMSANINGFSIT